MIILGIADGHNASASLMREGVIVGLCQEERFSRVKNQTGFPKLAIDNLVNDHLDGDVSKIDHVVLSSQTIDPYFVALDRYSDFSVADWINEMHDYWHPYFYGDKASVASYWINQIRSATKLNHGHHFDLDFLMNLDRPCATKHFNEVVRKETFNRLYGTKIPITVLKHHDCHAHYAFFGCEVPNSIRDDVLVLTADAWGDGENWTAWVSEGGALRKVGGGSQHIVARIYKFVTLILGMKPNEHEYKVMGLSAYSHSRPHIEEVERIFVEALDFVDGEFVSRKPLKESYFDVRNRLEGKRFDNIAAGLQSWASTITSKWVEYWLKKTNRSFLCFTGGLSMNIKLNGDLLSLPNLKGLSVPASGGDESLSAGACFLQAQNMGLKTTPLRHVYLGAKADFDAGWSSRLAGTGFSEAGFTILDDVSEKHIAALIAKGHIVARCKGRNEFGARALGNRSILADPRKFENLRKINNTVKNRDFWMPFTPSMLAEQAGDYLENPKNVFSPFMTIGFVSKPTAHEVFAAALHPADMSARPQFVRREDNADYWQLIKEFSAVTGVAGLLNTSLNLHGEPMNGSLADAVRTAAKSDIKCISAANNKLIVKSDSLDIVKQDLQPISPMQESGQQSRLPQSSHRET